MISFDNNIKLTIIAYTLFSIFLYNLKLPQMFNENGEFKSFGITPNKTIYPFWLVTLMFGIFIYYILIIKNENYL
tara:strand:- start:713 stop:937 length:225 start_codon:yes stop_codon:yes gene_type:complete